MIYRNVVSRRKWKWIYDCYENRNININREQGMIKPKLEREKETRTRLLDNRFIVFAR